MSRNTLLDSKWVDQLDAASWLRPGSVDHEGLCTACNVKINVGHGGIYVVKAHMKSAKHGANVASLQRTVPIKLIVQQQPHPMCSDQMQTMKAEIICTLETAYKSKSFAGGDKSSTIFVSMFPDSKIAKAFSCGRTKQSYLLNHAIAPYVKSETANSIIQAGFYSVSFNESDGRMMICIRYLSDGEVIIQMLDLITMEALDAESCATLICQCVQDHGLPFSKWIGDFSDNCNVMRGIYSGVIRCLRAQPGLQHLIDIGGCTLHVVANAARIAIETHLPVLNSLCDDVHSCFSRSDKRMKEFEAFQEAISTKIP